ncbi:unnamed protein product [Gadus morhua 'NCC']
MQYLIFNSIYISLIIIFSIVNHTRDCTFIDAKWRGNLSPAPSLPVCSTISCPKKCRPPPLRSSLWVFARCISLPYVCTVIGVPPVVGVRPGSEPGTGVMVWTFGGVHLFAAQGPNCRNPPH